jgi:hypothetical protein
VQRHRRRALQLATHGLAERLRRGLVSTVLLALVVCLVTIAVAPNRASAADLPDVSCHIVSTGATICRIDRPTVNQPLTRYDQVRFAPGDQVHIKVGGCVQTGGAGDTWKSYYIPLDGDGLYYGTVFIPFATVRPMGFMWSNEQTFTIPLSAASAPDQLYLRLGYVDDNYDDNGYWGHDNGTHDQCRGIGNAFANLTITHGVAQPPADPLDLVWDKVDLNGIPINPRWGWQTAANANQPLPTDLSQFSCWVNLIGRPFNHPCTRQAPDFDTEVVCAFGSGPLPGHVNWGAATYQGTLAWDEFSGPFEDDDYNFRLTPLDDADKHIMAGLTTANNGTVGLEFDSTETIDHWTTRWWSDFHDTVDADARHFKDWPLTKRVIRDTKYAIVTGLFGLDAAHTPQTESHPVWALAIDLGSRGRSPNDDYWAMFAQNWGNEGFCGDADHTVDFDNNTFKFLLPWRPGATDVQIDRAGSDFAAKDAPAPDVDVRTGVGVVVGNHLPAPSEHGWVEGTLHLVWTGGSAIVARPRSSVSTETTPVEGDLKGQVLDHLPSNTLAQWKQTTPRSGLPADRVSSVTVHQPIEFLPPVPRRPAVHQLVNRSREATNAARVKVVSSVHHGRWPWGIAATTTAAPPRPAAEAPRSSHLTAITLGVIAALVLLAVVILILIRRRGRARSG